MIDPDTVAVRIRLSENLRMKPGKFLPAKREVSGMKREQAKRAGALEPASGVGEPQTEQGVSGSDEGNRIDLHSAVAGEYRFHGTLVWAFYSSGMTWFVAAETCAALEIANPRDAIKTLDPDERGVGTIYTPGGEQSANLITESALYFLIFKSRKPQARAFRRWVTSEVLSEIRKTGTYTASSQIGPDGSVHLPPLDAYTRYVVVGRHGEQPHIRRTTPMEMVTEFNALDIQVLCYALKNIEVFWNKVQLLESGGVTQERFSAIYLEHAVHDGAALSDRYLRSLKYFAGLQKGHS